jgi:hypothetical protein
MKMHSGAGAKAQRTSKCNRRLQLSLGSFLAQIRLGIREREFFCLDAIIDLNGLWFLRRGRQCPCAIINRDELGSLAMRSGPERLTSAGGES